MFHAFSGNSFSSYDSAGFSPQWSKIYLLSTILYILMTFCVKEKDIVSTQQIEKDVNVHTNLEERITNPQCKNLNAYSDSKQLRKFKSRGVTENAGTHHLKKILIFLLDRVHV